MKKTLRHSGGNGVIFADSGAEELLRKHLPALREPCAQTDSRLQQVKKNVSRTVWRCRLDEGCYYVKQYHSPDAAHRMARLIWGDDARREFRISRHLAKCGVATAEVLAAGRENGRAWMVSRAIEPAEPLDTWHDQRSESTDRRVQADVRLVAIALADLIGQMHNAGVLHRDLHTGNVLLQWRDDGSPALTLMDLHRVSRRRRLSRRARARNLSQLLHDRRHATSRTLRLAFLRRYLEVTGGPGSLRGWQLMVEHYADAHTQAMYRDRDRRVFENNKYFTRLAWPEGWRGHAVLASKRQPRTTHAAKLTFTAEQWREALAEPEKLFDSADAVVVKDSPSSTVVRRSLSVGPHVLDVYVKRHRRKRWFKALVDAFRPSRARRAFVLGHALLTRRIATAFPLAVLERRTGPVLRDSILITEAVAPAEHLNRFLDKWLGREAVRRQDIDTSRQRQLAHELLRQLGRLLMHLHQEGFAHRDLKSGNLLIHWLREGPPEVVLVDLDGLSMHRTLSPRRMFQGLMRLNVSLLECPSVSHAGRLRMLLGYLRRPGCGRINFKPYWRELERWSATKLRRQLASRRKRQKRLRR